jgi:hypothetical protein
MIQSKCGNGSLTNWCLANDAIPVPTKMDLPAIYTRMKQSNLETGIRVDDFDAVGLAQIAARTGPRQVVELCKPTARSWNDMLDVQECSDP